MRVLNRFLMLTLFGMALGAQAFDPGRPTGVGTGDSVDTYLGSVRYSLIRATARLMQTSAFEFKCECASNNPDYLCGYLAALTQPQRDYCRRFVRETVSQVYTLNTQRPITPFELTSEPIYMTGPDHVLRPVRAKTEYGPSGKITFQYDAVKNLLPSAALTLLAHEFSHKVEFGGVNYFVDDNSPIGPFTEPEGGRHLMDAVGAGMAAYAEERGMVGQSLNVQDVFSCEIKDEATMDMESQGSSVRLFWDLEQKNYETGIGNLPRDLYCSHWEDGKVSRLVFQIKIHESDGCAENIPAGRRWTRLTLSRVFTPRPGVVTPEPEILVNHLYPDFNATCAKPGTGEMALSYQTPTKTFRFEGKFLGSRTIPRQPGAE
jgi:hypothetical protein